jgi:hypothetical protein
MHRDINWGKIALIGYPVVGLLTFGWVASTPVPNCDKFENTVENLSKLYCEQDNSFKGPQTVFGAIFWPAYWSYATFDTIRNGRKPEAKTIVYLKPGEVSPSSTDTVKVIVKEADGTEVKTDAQ